MLIYQFGNMARTRGRTRGTRRRSRFQGRALSLRTRKALKIAAAALALGGAAVYGGRKYSKAQRKKVSAAAWDALNNDVTFSV